MLASLSAKKGRALHGLHLIEGRRAVSGALAAGAPIAELVITHESLQSQAVRVVCASAGVPVYVTSTRIADRIADTKETQGVVAVARIRKPVFADVMRTSRLLVLDGVQDPGNVGTLIRTAAWFGIEGVLTSGTTADLYNPKVVRSTAGALWSVETVHFGDTVELVERLEAAGFSLWLADLIGEPASAWRPEGRSALFLGSEGHGVSQAVADRIDQRVAIARGEWGTPVESLNVAISGAILMYQWANSG